MTKIPSNQLTNDFIFRLERQTGYALHDPEKPNLLVIDGLFDPSTVSDEPIALLGAFHSLDVTVIRDGKQASDVDLIAFHHQRHEMSLWFSLEFSDAQNGVPEVID